MDIPIVKFNNGIERTMDYHTRKSASIPDVSIRYMPLIPSWAITIHKSQGITLEHAEIDAGNGIFEMGQTYGGRIATYKHKKILYEMGAARFNKNHKLLFQLIKN